MHSRRTTRIPSSRRPRSAFSLIELVLVLGVMATLSAIAVPRYMRSVDHYRAEAAARHIIADLAYARSEAMHTSSARTIRYDAANDEYELVGIPHPDDATRPYVVDLGAAHYATGLVTAEFDAPGPDDAIAEVVFDVYGRPDSDGSVVVTSGVSTRTIVLDPETGGASLQ